MGQITIKLNKYKCISRSEAREIFKGLEKFKIVALDYEGLDKLLPMRCTEFSI